jgi:hypothetical protein
MKFLVLLLLASQSFASGQARPSGQCVYVHRNVTYAGPELPPAFPSPDYQRADQQRQYMHNGTVQFQNGADTMVSNFQAIETSLNNYNNDISNRRIARNSLKQFRDTYNQLLSRRNEMAANGANRFVALGGGGTLLEEFDYNLNYALDRYNEILQRYETASLEYNRTHGFWSVTDRLLNQVRTTPGLNPCTGCRNSSCNQQYARAESVRLARQHPRCPCPSQQCFDAWAETLEPGILSQLSEHQTLPPVEEESRGRPTGFDYTQQRHRSPSPSLEASYPELAILPLLHRLALPVADGIIQIGSALDRYRDSHDYPRIETPYGIAEQDVSTEALALRERVEGGDTLYRIGTRRGTVLPNGTTHRGTNTGDNAQFWSPENPNTPGYVERYGIPEGNISQFNFIERATMRPGSTFITRPAPGVGANGGGALEVVIPEAEGSIETQSHSSF